MTGFLIRICVVQEKQLDGMAPDKIFVFGFWIYSEYLAMVWLHWDVAYELQVDKDSSLKQEVKDLDFWL